MKPIEFPEHHSVFSLTVRERMRVKVSANLSLSLLLASTLVLSSCIKLPPIIHDIIPVDPIAPPVAVVPPDVPAVVPLPLPPPQSDSPELISTAPVGRPSIAIDPQGQPVVVWDVGVGNTLYLARRTAAGWASGVFVQGKRGDLLYDAGRIFLPHVEIDPAGNAWISAKFGVKEWGSSAGQGIWIVRPGATSAAWFTLTSMKTEGRGNANICLSVPNPVNPVSSPALSAFLIASDGRWTQFRDTSEVIATGQIPVGSTGEKVRGAIGSDGVLHAVMNGYTGQDGLYGNSRPRKAVAWSSAIAYKEQGSDMCHPSIAVDLQDPSVVYLASAYDVGIVANIWTGTRMLYPTTNLLVVARGANMGGVDRFGPQLAPDPQGGVWLAYCRRGRVTLSHLSATGSISTPREICAGSRPSIALDQTGHLHIVYSANGLKYRSVPE